VLSDRIELDSLRSKTTPTAVAPPNEPTTSAIRPTDTVPVAAAHPSVHLANHMLPAGGTFSLEWLIREMSADLDSWYL
jgi:hypothetical protein